MEGDSQSKTSMTMIGLLKSIRLSLLREMIHVLSSSPYRFFFKEELAIDPLEQDYSLLPVPLQQYILKEELF